MLLNDDLNLDSGLVPDVPKPRKAQSRLPDLISFAQENKLTVGSTTGGSHNRGSKHYSGNAIDIKNSGNLDLSHLKSVAESRGFKLRDERKRPPGQKVWGGPHWHIEAQDGPQGIDLSAGVEKADDPLNLDTGLIDDNPAPLARFAAPRQRPTRQMTRGEVAKAWTAQSAAQDAVDAATGAVAQEQNRPRIQVPDINQILTEAREANTPREPTFEEDRVARIRRQTARGAGGLRQIDDKTVARMDAIRKDVEAEREAGRRPLEAPSGTVDDEVLARLSAETLPSGPDSMQSRSPGIIERVTEAIKPYTPGLTQLDTPMGIKTDLPRGIASGLTLGAIGGEREISELERSINPNAGKLIVLPAPGGGTIEFSAHEIGDMAGSLVPLIGGGKVLAKVGAKLTPAARTSILFGGIETGRQAVNAASGREVDLSAPLMSAALGSVMGKLEGHDPSLIRRVVAYVSPGMALEIAQGASPEQVAKSALTNFGFAVGMSGKKEPGRNLTSGAKGPTVPVATQDALNRAERLSVPGAIRMRPRTAVEGEQNARQMGSGRPTTSIKNAATEVDRAEMDLPGLTPSEKTSWRESQDRARAKGYDKPEVADGFADQILSGRKRTLDVEESAGMQIRALDLKKSHRDLRRQIAEETNPDKIAELSEAAKDIKDKYENLSDALKQARADVARSLAFGRSEINEDYDFLSLQRDWKTDTRKELTGRNAVKVEEQANEIERLTGLLEKEQQKNVGLEADSAIKRIQRDIAKENRKQARGTKVRSLDDEASLLVNLVAQTWKKAHGSSIQPVGITELDVEVAKLVLKLARNRVQKGFVTAEGLVDQVHGLLKDVIDDLSKRDVRQMISGYGRETKPQSELQKQLNDLKAELRKGLKDEDVAAGTITARKQGPANTWPARQKAIEKQIAELERKIETADFSEKEKRGQPVLTAEGQRLFDRREAVKNQYQSLKRANEPGAGLRNAAAIRKAWMLSWIKTHVRNIVGTGLYQPFDELSRPLAASVDAVLSLRFAGERSVQGASPSAAINAMLHAVKVGGPEAMEILKRGATRGDMERHQVQEINLGVNTGNKFIDQGVHAIELAHNSIFRFMSASDKVFWEQAYKRNLIDRSTIQARNEARNDPKIKVKERAKELETDKQITADAMADAYTSTFNNNNAVSDIVKMARGYATKRLGPERGALANFGIDLFMPFDRTPTNVIARVLEASPVGVLKAATGGYKKSPLKVAKSIIDKSMTREERRQFSQALGHAGTGSALMVMAWYLTPKGILTVDDKDNVFLNVLGQKINISLLSPVGSILAVGARLRNQYDKNTLTTGSAAKIAARTPLDQPVLRATSQVTEFLRDPDRSGGRVGASLAFSGVPFSGAVRGVGQTIDPAENRYADSSFKQQFQRNVPKWRESLPELNEKGTKGKYTEAFRKKEIGSADLDRMVTENKLSRSDADTIKKAGAMSDFQYRFDGVDGGKALDRYESMDERQRFQVKEMMAKKAWTMTRSDAYTEAEKGDFKKRIQALGIQEQDPKPKKGSASSPFKTEGFKIPAFR